MTAPPLPIHCRGSERNQMRNSAKQGRQAVREREVWGVTGTCVEMKKWNFHCFCVPSPPSVGKSVAFWLRFLLILNCVWASLRSRSVGLEVGEPGPVPAIASSLNCTQLPTLALGTGSAQFSTRLCSLWSVARHKALAVPSFSLSRTLSHSLCLAVHSAPYIVVDIAALPRPQRQLAFAPCLPQSHL